MSRCVIIGGASIRDYALIKSYLRNDDYNIFCDSGLKHMESLNIEPHLIVGDFDSHENPNLDVPTIVLPCEKDDTDTTFAAKEAVKSGFEEFLIIGAVGERLDHTLGNISILLMLDSIGKKAQIADDYSLMEIVSKDAAYVDDSYEYFSLISIAGDVKGVFIENAKYPLNNAEITCDYQYGISNEVIPGKNAKIRVKEGRLLLVKVKGA